MISVDIIMVTSIITMLLCLFTAWIWRGRFVAIHWTMFLAMAISGAWRGWFYYNINLALVHGRSTAELILISRFIAEFVLITTSLMAIGALIYYYVNIRPDK